LKNLLESISVVQWRRQLGEIGDGGKSKIEGAKPKTLNYTKSMGNQVLIGKPRGKCPPLATFLLLR